MIGAEEICPFPVDPTKFSLLLADYKFFLSEFHAQGPAFLALELRPQIKLDDIEKIEVFTYHFAWFEIGSGAEKWKPTTRETADHSMPYVVAAVLIDGAYTDAIFAPERFSDPAHARADEEDRHHRGRRVATGAIRRACRAG